MGALKNILRHTVTYPRLTDWVTKLLPPSVTIFMLHRLAVPELGVEGIATDHLRNCLDYLQKNNYRFISIEDAVRRALANQLGKEKWVAFSLDDGFEEQVRLGAEIFQEFDCPVTCFLVTDFVDGKLWPWDYKLMHLARTATAQTIHVVIDDASHTIEMGRDDTEAFLLRFARQIAPESVTHAVQLIATQAGVDIPEMPPPEMQPTTWHAVREAEKKGMRFGPHSASHFILARTRDATLQDEIKSSSRRIRQECAQPAEVFCYPSGKVDEFDDRAIAAVRAQGLLGAVSAEPGYLEQSTIQQSDNYRFVLPRLPLPDNRAEFTLYVSWAQRVRERLAHTPLQQFYTSTTARIALQ
ncbi:MAG TPA: polysaccharide deacetylase family protein [Spongiibacteraceae bacterium]|nr:polysaccharide deacetylase family protein [Spongiibacteraceae bacterium]